MLKSLNYFQDQSIAIIPARGGSTRIKNKNLQKVGGISLLKNSLIACKESNLFKEIIVSTDSLDIENESKDLASVVHKRSKTNSSSTSSTESAILEVINDLPSLFTERTLIYLIQCTSPFLREKDLKGSFNIIRKEHYDYSCLISGYFTKKFIWRKNPETNIREPINYIPNKRPRSQDHSPLFIENGAFYAFGLSNFTLTNCRIHGEVDVYSMEELRSIDIDEKADLDYANFLSEYLK